MWNRTSKFSNLALGLASAAPLLLGVFSLMLALGVPPVASWFWPTPTANIAEAAALGDAARVRALAARGARLDLPQPVRPDFREGDAPPTMSPLEAAIRLEAGDRRRGDSVVGVLLDLGVRPPPPEMRRLYCLAAEVEAAEATALLQDAFDLSAGSCGVPPQATGTVS